MLGRLSLEHKVAIITGAAGGLGAATARLMAARGAKLILADLNFEGAAALAEDLPEAFPVVLDLGDEASIKAMFAEARSRYGRVDILHNNAADLSPETAGRDLDILTMSTDVWDRTFRVNVRGTMVACREALSLMIDQQSGSIINMVSSLALQGHIVQNAYSASKAALVQMTRCLAASYGPGGIRANALAPGLTLTPQVAKVFPAAVRHLVQKETLRDRLGEPDDIAELVAFLASAAAANINGQLLVSDGGCTSHVPDIEGYRALGKRSAPQ